MKCGGLILVDLLPGQVRLKHSNVEYCLINTNIKNVSTDALHLSAALIKYL